MQPKPSLSPIEPDAPAEQQPALAAAPAPDLRRLYDEHGTFVREIAARLAGPGVDADDLVQEVFVVAWRKQQALRPGDSPRPWLATIAIHVAQAARRRAKLRRFFGLDEVGEIPDTQTPASAFEKAEASRQVYAILEKIAEKKRTVFVLFELQGLSGQEIAAIVDCPLKTVWTRLHHARREFQEHLLRQQKIEAEPRKGGSRG